MIENNNVFKNLKSVGEIDKIDKDDFPKVGRKLCEYNKDPFNLERF